MGAYRTKFAKPPIATLTLVRMRERWKQDNTPARPDWAAHAKQCKGAYDCMRERRAV